MKYFLMLIPIFLAFTAGCESMQTETYGDYTPVISEHDPARDFRNDENGRMGFIVSEEADSRISPAELDSIMSESFMAANTYGLKYLEASALTCAANASGLGDRLSSARKHLRAGDVRADLSALGKKIGLAYILVIDISSSTDADEEVSTVISSESTMDDFYWPAFSILQMQTKGKANLETKLFSVASGDFLQTYSDSPAVIDTYDTTATYTASRAMISSENTTRRIENGNREKIASQRIKEQAESDKSVIGQIAVALSDASEYNLPMITPPPFAQKKYKDRISLFKAVYAAGFNSIFTSYFARYDGKTVSGDTVNGTGTFSFASKAICSGQWASAQSSGQCEYTLSSGAKYAGTFSGGKADGTGVFTDANGNRYEGEFKSGLRNGKGTLYIETPPNDVYIDGFGRVLIGQGVVYDNRDTLTNVMKLKKKCSYTVTAADGRYMTIKAQKNAPASSGKPSSPVK